jgi:hypothetical protein
MADVNATNIKSNVAFTGGIGNVTAIPFLISVSAATNGDVFVLPSIPAGMEVIGGEFMNTASTALTTLALGFRNADGTATSPVDGDATNKIPSADHWFAAGSIATAGSRALNQAGTAANGKGRSLNLTKAIVPIATLGGANIATATVIEGYFLCIARGQP